MRSIISGITYLLVGCSVILLIIVVFVNFKKALIPFIPDDIDLTAKTTDDEPTDDPDDKPPTDGNEENNIYEVPTVNTTVKVDDAIVYDGALELPVNGATGFASVDVEVYDEDYNVIASLKPGKGFRILKEDGTWWRIYYKDESGSDIIGWVRHNYCMINLPDVIPSIVYDNTNAYGSLFRANEEIIPNITGEQLYSYSTRRDGKVFNERLQKNEYLVPVLYAMAGRIYKAQQSALSNGDTLVIYEGFRPYDTQSRVYNAVVNLPSSQKNFGSYSQSMFIAYGISNHQIGFAIDTSLAKVIETNYEVTGRYKYSQLKVIEYTMPCAIHELSVRATLANAKDNIYAQSLQKYCTNAGLSSLASEWWHFNDEVTNSGIIKKSDGKYLITECYSVSPSS